MSACIRLFTRTLQLPAHTRTSGEGAKDLVLVQGKCKRRKIAREMERGEEKRWRRGRRVKGTREKERRADQIRNEARRGLSLLKSSRESRE